MCEGSSEAPSPELPGSFHKKRCSILSKADFGKGEGCLIIQGQAGLHPLRKDVNGGSPLCEMLNSSLHS